MFSSGSSSIVRARIPVAEHGTGKIGMRVGRRHLRQGVIQRFFVPAFVVLGLSLTLPVFGAGNFSGLPA